MKDKLLAIIDAPCDKEIKVELLLDFFKEFDDKRMMDMCNEFLFFSANRNFMMVNKKDGFKQFAYDSDTVSEEEIWGYFKKYLEKKRQLNFKYSNKI